MNKGILIFGPNGAGKSTLAHAVAAALGYREMDIEDYYFPEQRAARLASLEGDAADNEYAPFASPRTEEEVRMALLADIAENSEFVLTGVKVKWDEAVLEHIEFAVRLSVPLKTRLERIKARAERRFGERVLPGGDMYAQQEEFRRMVATRDEKEIDESEKCLKCPILMLDGGAPLETNVKKIADARRFYAIAARFQKNK